MSRVVVRGGAVALVAIVVAAGSVWSAEATPRVTIARQATTFDLDPARTYGPPSLVVDPENQLHAFALLAEVRSKRCGLMRSLDGGQSWTRLDASPSPPSYPFCLMTNAVTQGRLAFGRHHTLYYLLDGWDTQDGNDNRSVLLGRSTDDGTTWSTTVVSDNRGKQGQAAFTDKPVTGLAIDTTTGSADMVYVGWRREFPNSPSPVPPQPMVAVSADGGKTFGAPQTAVAGVFDTPAGRADLFKTVTVAATGSAKPVDVATNFGGVNPRIVVGGNGTVYVMWIARTSNISDDAPLGHYLSTSTDHGKTFTAAPINPFSPNNTSNYEVQLAWSPGGGPEGTLHLVYEGTDRPSIANWNNISYRRSTDGGKTWSPIKVVNDDDPKQLLVDRIPDVRTAPGGRVDVVWWSTRDNPGLVANDAYYAFSTDDGATWSRNVRVTDRPVNRAIGPFGNNFDLWGPPGLASTDDFALVAWDDTRNGNQVTQTQDIYAAAVQHRSVGRGTSKAAKYALAGALGLVACGLLVFVATWLSGRRRSAEP